MLAQKADIHVTVDVISVAFRDEHQRNDVAAVRHFDCSTGSWRLSHRVRNIFPTRRSSNMNHYDFIYFGPYGYDLKQTIAEWCKAHDCRLETTTLLKGSRFSISGSEETVRAAIRSVRVWLRTAA